MFAIASENGINDEGKTEYDIFGVNLEPSYDINQTMGCLGKTNELKNNNSLLNRIIQINNRHSVFSYNTDPNQIRSLDLPWEEIKNIELKFSTLRKTDQYFGYYPDEMHYVARRFFNIGNGNGYSNLEISTKLMNDLTLLSYLKFKIVRVTEKKEVLGHPRISALKGYGNISLAKYNSLILMLLTNTTKYIDGNDEKDIIIDDVKREVVDWVGESVILKPRKYTLK